MNPKVEKIIGFLRLTYNNHVTFQNICQFVETLRGKALRIEPDNMPLGLTGYCIPLSDVDLVCYRDRGTRHMNLPPQLHELGHLLLGHVEAPDNMLGYAEFIRGRGINAQTPDVIKYRGMQFDDPDEHDAEALATLLLGLVLESESGLSLSPVARELYGD